MALTGSWGREGTGVIRIFEAACMVMVWLQTVCAGEWQWVVALKGFVSDETKKEPEAFLWCLRKTAKCMSCNPNYRGINPIIKEFCE